MTALIDALQEIMFGLRHNKLRSLLTAFGVFWGIFMLILLLGAGQGLQNGIVSDFSGEAADTVWVNSRKTSVPYLGLATGRDIRLTMADLNAVQMLPEVLVTSSEQSFSAEVSHGRLSHSFSIVGVGDAYFDIKTGVDNEAGRQLNALDDREFRKVAMIGSSVAKTLFAGQNPIGAQIAINRITFTVVGQFHETGNNGRMSERIYVPISLYQKTFGKGEDYVGSINYRPAPSADPWQTEDTVMTLLRQRHKVSPDDRSALRSYNLLNRGQWVNGLFAAINTFIWFVGIGTLTAGIVGISNIMMITVKERTMEIGVRKALGATPASIIRNLLFESILVTAAAGYLGLVCAVGLLEAINSAITRWQLELSYFKHPEVNFQVAVTAIVLLVCAGALAGFAPAWRASKIAPVEAMRAQ